MKTYIIVISENKMIKVKGGLIQYNARTHMLEIYKGEDIFTELVATVPTTMLIIITDEEGGCNFNG